MLMKAQGCIQMANYAVFFRFILESAFCNNNNNNNKKPKSNFLTYFLFA